MTAQINGTGYIAEIFTYPALANLKMLKKAIISTIDFFYPLFQKVMPLHTFRYATCGGANVFLDITLYFIIYNFILEKQVLDLEFIAFEPHIAAFLLSFFVTFPVGFLLSKYIVWTNSLILWHIQLFRDFLIVMVNLLLNYIFIKLFVEYLHIYPTISKILITIIVVSFSYISQKHFSFKARKIHSTEP